MLVRCFALATLVAGASAFGGPAPTPPPCAQNVVCMMCAESTFCSWCATLKGDKPEYGGRCIFPRDVTCPDGSAAEEKRRGISFSKKADSLAGGAGLSGYLSKCPPLPKGFKAPTPAPTAPTPAPTAWVNPLSQYLGGGGDPPAPPPPAPSRSYSNGGGGGGGGASSSIAKLQAKIAMMKKEAALRAEIARLGGGGR